MNNENQQVIFCENGEFRIYCSVCDKLCIERFYIIHLKSQTHIKNNRKLEQLDNSFQVMSLI